MGRVELLARAGYAAKGVVYAIIGVLAVQAALGSGGQTVGATGALQQMAQEPFARILLGLMTIGLFGYGLWRLIQATLDKENEGQDAKGMGKRVGQAVSGVLHFVLAAYAGYLTVAPGSGQAGQSGQTSKQGMVAWVMSRDFGTLLIALVGVAIAVAGLSKIARGVKGDYKSELIPDQKVRRLYPVCSGGIIARGVIFLVIGGFVTYAGIAASPEKTAGLPQALGWLRDQPYGLYLMLAVAIGLVAYAVYSFIQARYRLINV